MPCPAPTWRDLCRSWGDLVDRSSCAHEQDLSQIIVLQFELDGRPHRFRSVLQTAILCAMPAPCSVAAALCYENEEMPLRRFLCVAIMAFWSAMTVGTAGAEVRFGNNVRVGGHDVSNQTFNSKRRGEFYIYNKTPRNEGCQWRTNRDGSRTKVCHYKRKTN
jgi:hypothetical protein